MRLSFVFESISKLGGQIPQNIYLGGMFHELRNNSLKSHSFSKDKYNFFNGRGVAVMHNPIVL